MPTPIQRNSHASRASRFLRRGGVTVVAASAFLLAPGCDNAGSGAVAGGLLGALGGLAIGSVTGSGGKGAVIGAVAGAAAGGVIGDQNARSSNRNYSHDNRGTYSSHGHRSTTYESYKNYDSGYRHCDSGNVDVSIRVYDHGRSGHRYGNRYGYGWNRHRSHGHRYGCGCGSCR